MKLRPTRHDFIVPIVNDIFLEPVVAKTGTSLRGAGLDRYAWFHATNVKLRVLAPGSRLVSYLEPAIMAAAKAPMHELDLVKQSRQILHVNLTGDMVRLPPGDWNYRGYTFAEEAQVNRNVRDVLPKLDIPALILEDVWDPGGEAFIVDAAFLNDPRVAKIKRASRVYPVRFKSRQEMHKTLTLRVLPYVSLKMVRDWKYRFTWEIV